MSTTIRHSSATSSIQQDTIPPSAKMTIAEFMAFEKASPIRHHYYHGRITEVAGGTYEHNLISANLLSRLTVALDETDCRTLGSDMKVMVSEDIMYYQDVVVTCGDPLISFEEALQNPILIAEVLSSSTASFDRGEKFRQYRTIASLKHILFLEQDRPAVEHYAYNTEGEWVLRHDYKTLDQQLTLTIGAATISLPLSKIYRDVTFPLAMP